MYELYCYVIFHTKFYTVISLQRSVNGLISVIILKRISVFILPSYRIKTRDVRKELLISIWRPQISSKPKSVHFMPSKNSPWLEMQSFSRCNHFLKASRYADLGTVIRYWWIADPSAYQDSYFRSARNYFNFGNIKKSYRARSRNMGGEANYLLFLSSKTPYLFRRHEQGHCHEEDGNVQNQWHCVVSDNIVSAFTVLCLCSTFRWCFCPFPPTLLLWLLHQSRKLHTKPTLY